MWGMAFTAYVVFLFFLFHVSSSLLLCLAGMVSGFCQASAEMPFEAKKRKRKRVRW
jgi:hypothetical protein